LTVKTDIEEKSQFALPPGPQRPAGPFLAVLASVSEVLPGFEPACVLMLRWQISLFRVQEKRTMRGENFRALSSADYLSRVSSDRTRVAVPLLELPATSVPRANIAFPRISVLTSDNVGVCVDDEYATDHSGN